MRELHLQDNNGAQQQKKNQVTEEQWKPEEKVVDPGLFAVSGVYFTCPLLGPEVLPRHEIENNILQFLLQQPPEELGMSACLIIHSCNKGREKVQACVDTLCKYLTNIIQNPTETKFQKIKCNNKVFQEKVAPLAGVPQFLQAAGFEKQVLPAEGGGEPEEFYVFTATDQGAIARLTVFEINCVNYFAFWLFFLHYSLNLVCFAGAAGYASDDRPNQTRIGSEPAGANARSGCSAEGTSS